MPDHANFKQEFMTRLLHIARSGALGLTAGALACGGQGEHTGETSQSTGGTGAGGDASADGRAAAGGSGGLAASGGTGGSLIQTDAAGATTGSGGSPSQCDAAVLSDGGGALDAASDSRPGEVTCITRTKPDRACPTACEA